MHNLQKKFVEEIVKENINTMEGLYKIIAKEGLIFDFRDAGRYDFAIPLEDHVREEFSIVKAYEFQSNSFLEIYPMFLPNNRNYCLFIREGKNQFGKSNKINQLKKVTRKNEK